MNFHRCMMKNSEILILGSFPSVKSREMQFFYGHPQNRFWKVMAQVLHENVPQTIPEKKEMLLRHHIALWDVIASCDIAGSSDSSIRNVVPNDLGYIISRSRITKIYANGAKSKQLYDKYLSKQLGIEAVQLPSTSRRMLLTVWSGCWNIGKRNIVIGKTKGYESEI